MPETKPEKKEAPPQVLLAMQVLESLQPGLPEDKLLTLRKQLPALALKLAKEGAEVTEALLRAHIEKGIEAGRKSEPLDQKRSYDAIVKALPVMPRPAFKNAMEELRHYAQAGDVETCARIIDQNIVVQGWGEKPISYEHLVEPACRHGHLALLKFAVENDPGLLGWRVVTECGHAMEKGCMDILRYVTEELKLDLQEKYSQSPYSMYVKAAIEKQRWHIAEYILPGFFKDMRSNPDLREYLFEAALEAGRTDYVQKFLDGGMTSDKMYFSMMTLKVNASSDDMIEFLIRKKFFTGQQLKAMYEDMGFRYGERRQKLLQEALAAVPMGLFERLGHKWKLLKDFKVAARQERYTIAAELAKHIGIPRMLWSRNITQAEGFARQWRRMLGSVPIMAGEYDPARVKQTVYDDALALIRKEGLLDSVAERYAYHAASLFCATDRVLQYLEKWGRAEKQPLHDIIHQIDLPRAGEIDAKAWGDAVLQCGPEMAKLTAFADKMKTPLKTADGKRYSLAATRDEVAKFVYYKGNQNPEFARLCLDQKWKEYHFNAGLKIIRQYRRQYGATDNAKADSRIPGITIEGEEFGMPGYRFRKLKDGDLRGFFLGEYTGCCQHLAGAGSECAEHGFLSRNGGFYVVEDKEGKIVGQSWAWRGKDSELVFDSLEYLGDRMNVDNWQKICELAAKQVESQPQDISAIRIGAGGKTPALQFRHAAQGAAPVDYSGYRDSRGAQYNVWNRFAPRIS